MPLPANVDFLSIAGFSSASDNTQFTTFTGFTINTTTGRATCTGAAGSRMLTQTPTDRNYGVTVSAIVTTNVGLMMVTGASSDPVSSPTNGAKFEIFTNAAGDKSMRLYILGTSNSQHFDPVDTEFFSSAPCPYPDGEFHTVTMTVRRTGWFVSIDNVIVLWLKAFTGPVGSFSNYAAFGRGNASSRFSGIVDKVGSSVIVDSITIQATRNWGDPLNQGLDSTMSTYTDVFLDDFSAISGNWNPLFGPAIATQSSDTANRLQNVLAPSTTFTTNTAGGGVLTCSSVGAFTVLGQGWDLLELDRHGVMWEIDVQVGTGQWQLGIQLSSVTPIYLFINCTSLTGSALLMGYDAGGKVGFTYPWASAAGSIAAGTWIGLRAYIVRNAAGALSPITSTDVRFEAYNYTTGTIVGGFTFSAAGSAGRLNGVAMGSYGVANATIGGLIVRRFSGMLNTDNNYYPITVDNSLAPNDISDPTFGNTSQRGHLASGGGSTFIGRPATLYRGLDLLSSNTEGG
jgi:hypothetical protein